MHDIRFERQALYEEIWTDPVNAVSARYGLSDVGLRKICKKLGVPLPPRGYWARVRAGERVKRAPLGDDDGPTMITHQVPVDSEEAARREEVARIRRERWSASIRAQVEAREQRLRGQAEFFDEADKWIELQHRLQYLDHIENSTRDASLSVEDMALVGEWIERTRAMCLTTDRTEKRIRAILGEQGRSVLPMN